jgi:hypothetical protein
MSLQPPTKCVVAYRIRRAAVKICQTNGDLHGIMNLRGLF